MAQYTTGEVAKLCAITVRTVQYWDDRGLVSPSDTTEGGRRLYSDDDLSQVKVVCFLKDLGFSLKDIEYIVNDSDSDKIIEILAEEQLAFYESEMAKNKAQIDKLNNLKSSLKVLSKLPYKPFETIATVMDGRKKLRNLRIMMFALGLVMDVCWIGGLLLWIFQGLWWMFIIGIAIAIILGIFVSWIYIAHTAYICPNDRTVFRAPLRKMLFAAHTPTTRKLICPHCKKKVNCVEIYAPSNNPTRIDGYLIWDS